MESTNVARQCLSSILLSVVVAGMFAWAPTIRAEEKGRNEGVSTPNPALVVPEKDWHALQKQQVWAQEKLDNVKLRSEWVKVKSGTRSINAWVVYPKRKKAPVVLVLHEAFGMTNSTRLTAAEIAEMGYVAIAADMVSGYGPNHGDADSFVEPGTLTYTLAHLTDAAVNADINALGDYAAGLPESNGELAIAGLSWGGGAAFRYATTQHRKDVRAIFVFYDIGPPKETQKVPDAATPLSVEAISVPVYGFYPTGDKRTMSGLQPTKEAMASAKKPFEWTVYQGADHAFLRVYEDPSNNNPANEFAYHDAMKRLKSALKVCF